MTWGKLDDGFWRHPKVRAAARRDLAAVGLFAQAISLASEYETDGRLAQHDLEELCPRPRRRRKLVGILVRCGLLDRAGEELVIHDYLVYNKSKAQLEQERAEGTRRKARQRGRPPVPPGEEVQAA